MFKFPRGKVSFNVTRSSWRFLSLTLHFYITSISLQSLKFVAAIPQLHILRSLLMDPASSNPFAYVYLKPTALSFASSGSWRSSARSVSTSEYSKKKRKRNTSTVSFTTSDFAESTRVRTENYLDGQCFHCEMKYGSYAPMDVCHVIPKKSCHVILSFTFSCFYMLTSLALIVLPLF